MKVAELAEKLQELKVKFNRKAWMKQYQKKKAICPRCFCEVCEHMMGRHQDTNKCKRFYQVVSKSEKPC